MPDELVLYSNPRSRSRTARWMLEEVGAPYRVEVMGYGPAMKAPSFLAINPMGKVPVITHGATVVTETAAICAYLADAFPAAGLAPPPGSSARGAYYRWLFFAAGPLEAAIMDATLGVKVAPEQEGMVGYGTLATVLDTLEGAVSGAVSGGGFLAGDSFSAADLYVGAHLAFGLGFGTIGKRPAFEAYVARMSARPAAMRARAADDAALPPA